MDQLQRELLQLLSLGHTNQNTIIKRLDKVVMQHGTNLLQKWRNFSNNDKNSFLHELVEQHMEEVMRHVLERYELDVNVRRTSDGLTPYRLALKNGDNRICDLLKKYGASDDVSAEDNSQWLSDEDREKAMNIVWMDLEMTSIETPEILECAVIITDKDLNELERSKVSFMFLYSLSPREDLQKGIMHIRDVAIL